MHALQCAGTQLATEGYRYFVSQFNSTRPMFVTDSTGARYRILMDLHERKDRCNATLHQAAWQSLAAEGSGEQVLSWHANMHFIAPL